MEAYCCLATKIKIDLYEQKTWRRNYWNTQKVFKKTLHHAITFQIVRWTMLENKSQNNLHHVLLTSLRHNDMHQEQILGSWLWFLQKPSNFFSPRGMHFLSKVFFPHRYVKYIPWACETFHLICLVTSTHSVNEKIYVSTIFFHLTLNAHIFASSQAY